MISNFAELQIVQKLAETHQGTTEINLVKHEQKLLVCKSLRKDALKDKLSIEHANNQKDALQHFAHNPHINYLIKTFQDPLNLYMVISPAWGLPLDKMLKMMGPLNQAFTRVVMVQIALILKEFHSEGYIYRDVKASNFTVDSKGRVMMMDLGHSKLIKNGRTKTVCGTPHAMPPEVYDSQEGYSFEFDHYSYGILLYELLKGRPPFGYGIGAQDKLRQDITEGLTPQHLVDIAADAADLIAALLEKAENRLGRKGGFGQILEHDYFNVGQFMQIKDLFEGNGQIDATDERYRDYLQEIVDFGIDAERYGQIPESDPFYKFTS